MYSHRLNNNQILKCILVTKTMNEYNKYSISLQLCENWYIKYYINATNNKKETQNVSDFIPL